MTSLVLPPTNGIVTLLTDFGVTDSYVGIMKGAVLRHDRQAQLIDVTHDVAPQDVELGAFHVAAMIGRFPAGTVHVVVVDPGVGTDRRPLAVLGGEGCYWIAPDNGVLTPVLANAEVRALDLERLRLQPESNTFHGRDVFAPVAGMLSRGQFGYRALGDPIEDAERLPSSPQPRIVMQDRFGNLVTNIWPGPATRGLRVGGRDYELRRTYGDVELGEPLALVSSFGTLELAVRNGSAAEQLGLVRGDAVEEWRQE